MKRMTIVFLDASTIGEDVSLEPIAQQGDFVSFPSTVQDKVSERIADAEIVITNKVRLFQPEIDSASRLKLICIAATGTDNVEIDHARLKGIIVKNVSGYSTHSVAQICFSHILHLSSHLSYYNHYVHCGEYANSLTATHLGDSFSELNGRRLGIIGLGNIGQKVAQIAIAFGMEVVYYSTSGTHHCKEYPSLSLTEVLESSDIVSIHAPLNSRTMNLISTDQLRLMKPTALLINMGRGGIVNETDLVKAINEGVIAGAGVDVFSQEPIKQDHPFYGVGDQQRLLLTPHIAWTSIEARRLLIEKIAENIRNYIKESEKSGF